MTKAIFAVAALAGVMTLNAAPAAAQSTCTTGTTCSIGYTASVDVPTLISMTVSAASVALTAPSFANLGTNVDATGPAITVKANQDWALSVKADNADFTWTKPAGSSITGGARAANTLSWSTTSGGTYAALSTSDATVTSGSATNSTANTVYFRMAIASAYDAASNRPGTYNLGLTFTVTAQ